MVGVCHRNTLRRDSCIFCPTPGATFIIVTIGHQAYSNDDDRRHLARTPKATLHGTSLKCLLNDGRTRSGDGFIMIIDDARRNKWPRAVQHDGHDILYNNQSHVRSLHLALGRTGPALVGAIARQRQIGFLLHLKYKYKTQFCSKC